MRVIAGQLKGRRLKSVPGKNTRPTSDKVKEAAFHMIGPYFDGGQCLDLFAGSGALGIEAISRGMDRTIFVERNGMAIRTIYENIKEMKLENQIEIMRMDAKRALQIMNDQQFAFDLVLMDPPYKTSLLHKLLDQIIHLKLLTQNGIVLCEHDTSIELSQKQGLELIKQSTYGTTTITIYKKK